MMSAGNEGIADAAIACASVTRLGAITLVPAADVIEREFTRFLRTRPGQFVRQGQQVDFRPGPPDAVATIAPGLALVVPGSDDDWPGPACEEGYS